MNRIIILFSLLALAITGATFANGSKEDASKPVVIVWYPNESAQDYAVARAEIGKIITKAIGRPVVDKLTTDYNIAIEALATKNANIGFFGPLGHIMAHNRSASVLPLVVNSGASGTLKDAIYYSWLAVRQGDEGKYSDGKGGFNLENVKGKAISWVSTSSTSGYKVPSTAILGYFQKKPEYAKLSTDDLLQGGDKAFFPNVLYGNSHQGSAFNLLSGKADIAAFCDTELINYSEVVSGSTTSKGSVLKIRDDATEPFTSVRGKRYVLVHVIPVANGPFSVNIDTFTADEIKKLQAAFTSDEVANNPLVFSTDSKYKGMFKHTKNERFLTVDDKWYDPIRAL